MTKDSRSQETPLYTGFGDYARLREAPDRVNPRLAKLQAKARNSTPG